MASLNYFRNCFVILVLIASFHDVKCQDWQEALENFTWLKLDNYTAWLSNNNLDPSPIISGPTLILTASNVASISYYLTKHGVRDHSVNDFEINSVIANFSRNNLNVDLKHVQGLEFFGDFRANGTLANGNRVSGEGEWHIKVDQVTGRNWGITYTVNPNGFLNPNGFFTESTLLGNIGEFKFGRFFEEEIPVEWKEQLKADLVIAFGNYLEGTEDHPLKSLFYQYLLQVFKSTPWPGIIGTPSRPPTSTSSAKF